MDDLKHATELSSALSALLPRIQQTIETQQQEADQTASRITASEADLAKREADVQAREAALTAREATLAMREAEVATREASCKATMLQNEHSLEELKQREQELSKKLVTTKKAPGMDSLSMQVLARATATALLKTAIAEKASSA
mmetsp:Transcript_20354/g.41404  ORF Transcript_20354/g.41404 Transcript_20354/m.41404 type:complete len:144 (-) Transcript_20354:144-575(-)